MKNDILRNIVRETYNRWIPDDVELVERNGYIFFAHPKWRYDPITIAMVVGTTLQVAGTLQQGKQTEKIAKRQAEIDIADAEAVRRASIEEAQIEKEKGQRLIEGQKSVAAAGGIRLNVGVPLVITDETQADIAKDIGFGLERGRVESRSLREQAALGEALGKKAKKRSRISALSQGLLGAADFGFKAKSAGLFKKPPPSLQSQVPGTSGGFVPRF